MKLFQDGRLLLVAGPCVVEGRDITLRIAGKLRDLVATRHMDLLFKASFDKANRTSPDSFRGLGMDRALSILGEVRRETGVPVHTDVHEPGQVETVANVVDTIQIPAFLCRQTNLLLAAGATGKPVFVKKGQFLAPEDMQHPLNKVESVEGHGPVVLMERGSTFGYGNLVVDFRSLPIMRRMAPVVFDATHSVQRPGGLGHASGGDSTLAPYLARAAVAVGVDGLFLETHPEPAKALSDGPNMIPLADLPRLLDQIERIRDAVGSDLR
ncbi:MAG: 3-deoxy-8-phosphooctulonate synthase [Planctomycetota bacterium]|jgi:2-dehydro-3-deoxyphosphooctonate aldolase (KDO 8-P synthase)